MRQLWRWAIVLLAFALGLALAYVSVELHPLSGASRVVTTSTDPTVRERANLTPSLPSLTYEYRSLDTSDVHILVVPHSGSWIVRPRLASTLQSLDAFAVETGAIAALNGGYFDPANEQSTSFVTIDGVVVADPRENTRLMGNPDLEPYLPKILNRSEFRRYQCGATQQYAIALHNDPVPTSCRLVDALGAGPQLLPTNTSLEEGFIDVVHGVVVRDAIGETMPNARSAIGITAAGDLILLMAAQQPGPEVATGMTLVEVADMLRSLGAVAAMNLDGGSSSSFVHEGEHFYGKVGDTGERINRSVRSALVVQSIEP